MKYRKKPVVIEAFKYDGDLKGADGKWYVPDWAVMAFESGEIYYGIEEPWELYIKTLEGVHHVSVGDYIIKGVQDELYPCKPDIFEQTYEEQGRLIELPCAVGDTVYSFSFNIVYPFTVNGFEINKDGVEFKGSYCGEEKSLEYWSIRFPVSKIGKTVFLTPEEAEAKLKG